MQRRGYVSLSPLHLPGERRTYSSTSLLNPENPIGRGSGLFCYIGRPNDFYVIEPSDFLIFPASFQHYLIDTYSPHYQISLSQLRLSEGQGLSRQAVVISVQLFLSSNN
uniref:JmjC domain-containing protein n=1 Tax=Steinernema glaseri TaxID=37863 RepID=A0A1I7ZQU9_9BILA